MQFNELFWHDGILKSISICNHGNDADSYVISLDAFLYADADAPERALISIEFFEVTSFIATCDFNELLDNKFAGNINDGYMKGSSTYRLFFVDGYLEIVTNKISIKINEAKIN